MTFKEAREWIDHSNQYGSKLGLETITELLQRLGNPQDKLKVLHVAGTNGKGSTTAFLVSILAAQGYSAGRYISPAVFTYCERLQITEKFGNQIMTRLISEEAVGEIIGKIKPACEEMVTEGYPHPTSFEIETAMAFLYLLKEKVDFAVIEVGMGGRLDATNVVSKPLLDVITSISMDHMQYLGDTLGKIATEKAGIIKERTPVVTGNTHPEVLEVIQKVCEEREAPLIRADINEITDYSFSPEGTEFVYQSGAYRIGLLGEYQINNALLAIKAAETLRIAGIAVSDAAIRNGLQAATWRGRLEILGREPYFLIDGAHNEDAAWQLRRALELYFKGRRLIFIMGVLADKDYPGILRIIGSLADIIYTVTPNNSRGLDSSLLAAEAIKHCSGRVIDAVTVLKAVSAAYQEAQSEDVILAFGSLSYLRDVTDAIIDKR